MAKNRLSIPAAAVVRERNAVTSKPERTFRVDARALGVRDARPLYLPAGPPAAPRPGRLAASFRCVERARFERQFGQRRATNVY